MQANQTIFTTQPSSKELALEEIQKTDMYKRFPGWLADGIGRVQLNQDFTKLAVHFKNSIPIFTRHICPVHICHNLKIKNIDIDILADVFLPLLAKLNRQLSVSVQTRFIESKLFPYKPYQINTKFAEIMQAEGFAIDIKEPQQVISIVCTTQTAYIGASKVSDNLSSWAGGAQRFAWEKNQINRSEFKLLEAMKVFNLDLPGNGLALDLGASPGGWTKVLLANNFNVIAVDPAELHNSIKESKKVTHIREKAQDYLRRNTSIPKFDLIVNDIRTDISETIKIVLFAKKYLTAKGRIILTLKLRKNKKAINLSNAMSKLKNHYTICGARQLFHNRHEVTVVLSH